jgi:hypothetical protein
LHLAKGGQELRAEAIFFGLTPGFAYGKAERESGC